MDSTTTLPKLINFMILGDKHETRIFIVIQIWYRTYSCSSFWFLAAISLLLSFLKLWLKFCDFFADDFDLILDLLMTLFQGFHFCLWKIDAPIMYTNSWGKSVEEHTFDFNNKSRFQYYYLWSYFLNIFPIIELNQRL